MTLAKWSCGTHAKKIQRNSTLCGINLLLKDTSVTGPGNTGCAVIGKITFCIEKSLKIKEKNPEALLGFIDCLLPFLIWF